MKKVLLLGLLLLSGRAFSYDCNSANTPPGMIRDGSCVNNVMMTVNPDGSINVNTESPSAAIALGNSTAAESSHVIKASAGTLFSLVITNAATAGYLLLYDATSAPTDGAVVPKSCWAMPATTSSLSAPFYTPAKFSTGIVAVYSSTGCFTQTSSATAAFYWQVQ